MVPKLIRIYRISRKVSNSWRDLKQNTFTNQNITLRKSYATLRTLKPNPEETFGPKILEHSGIIMVTNRKMSTKTLYKIDQSPPARTVMMIIDLLGLDVKLEDLNPVAREQDEPEFVKMNPMRTIPILDEGDFSLGDSHAIMIYLLETYGKPEHEHLYPKDTRKKATINHVLFFECGILFPRLRAIMAPTYKGRLTELSKYMKINMDDAYGMVEVFLSDKKFVADDVLTIADFSVFTTLQSLDTMHPVDEERFPKVKQWLKTMSNLDVVKRVNEPGGSMHGLTLLKIMDMNKENQERKAKL